MGAHPVTTQELLARLEQGSKSDAFEAAKAFADRKGARLVAGLTRILRSAEKPYSREAAAYALTWLQDPAAIKSLLMCASDPDEEDSVRAQAVEGLAEHLEFDPARSRLRQRAEDLMIQLLESSSQTLRFWACFGLGKLECRRAIPRLRELMRTDNSVCPGWWYVREEAEDAIGWIEGRAGQHRVPVHMRKQRKAKPAAAPKRRPKPRARARTAGKSSAHP